MPFLDKDIPNFNKNFETAKRNASKGFAKRKDMPVISSRDIDSLEKSLKSDGVSVTRTKIPIDKLKPVQKQIYFDKAITILEKGTMKETTSFLQTKIFVVSNDNHIIDGHHRYLAGMLIDPKLKVSVLKIDLPTTKLLDVARKYSDGIGNTRNESLEKT